MTSAHTRTVGRDQRRGYTFAAVLPAYNEEARIEQTVRHVASVLATLVDTYQIVVTDDGSRDRTAEILSRLPATEPGLHLRVVTHPTNLGYGAALTSGFDAATADLLLLLDADGQFDVSELVHLLAAMDAETDLVIGYRVKRADLPIRLLDAWGWKQLVNGLFGYTARDVDCAFKLFRREVWSSVHVDSRGATFSAEFLIKAPRLQFHIKEVPVTQLPRRASSPTGARPSVIVRAFLELFRLRLRLNQELAVTQGPHRVTPLAA